MLAMAPTSPASSEEMLMPPLVALDDVTEILESAAEGQGAICTVTPMPKTYGRRYTDYADQRHWERPKSQQ